jgi:hypothetical protein
MMEFEALRIPALTQEVAARLENSLVDLPGVEWLKININTQEVQIIFDENQLNFLDLIRVMATAGCPLHNINAALLKEFPGYSPTSAAINRQP